MMKTYALKAIEGGGGGGLGLMRAVMAIAEPFYTFAVVARNRLYDIRGGTDLGRRTISVGNITTGGTGKTPVVRWLANELRAQGMRPAVLLRGYRVSGAMHSDEQLMLDQQLNGDDGGSQEKIAVIAHPSRIKGA